MKTNRLSIPRAIPMGQSLFLLFACLAFGPAQAATSRPDTKSKTVKVNVSTYAYGTYNLINANTDQSVAPILGGETFAFDQVGNALNIDAIPPQAVGSVKFIADDGSAPRTEGVAPYAFKGDTSGDFASWTPAVGTLNLTVEYYSGTGASGTLLGSDNLSITFVDAVVTGTYRLINSSTDQPIADITGGETFALDEVGNLLNIEAVPSSAVGSAVFISDDGSAPRTETTAPYAYKGDTSGNYLDWTPNLGTLTLTVEYYNETGGNGTQIGSDSFSITFVQSNGGGGQWSESGTDIYYDQGKVGIGTDSPDYELTVKGRIHTQEVKVDLLGAVAPDYVFYEDYALKSLKEVSAYIEKHGHLPNIPSASEMQAKGVNLKEMNLRLLEKIEELTLYLIRQQELIEEQELTNASLQKRLAKLEKYLEINRPKDR